MSIDFYYFTICTFLLIVFAAAVYISLQGSALAKYFLWAWAVLLIAAVPFASFISDTVKTYAAGLALLFFLYTIFIFGKRNQPQLDIAQDEMRRVLAESNVWRFPGASRFQ